MSSESVQKLQMNSPSLSDEKSHSEILPAADDECDHRSPHQSATNGTAKSSISDCNEITDDDQGPKRLFGWFGFQPKIFQTFLSAKWALFWLCWAGAMQGK